MLAKQHENGADRGSHQSISRAEIGLGIVMAFYGKNVRLFKPFNPLWIIVPVCHGCFLSFWFNSSYNGFTTSRFDAPPNLL